MTEKERPYATVTSNVSSELKKFLASAAESNSRTISAEIADRLEFTRAAIATGVAGYYTEQLDSVPADLVTKLEAVADANNNSLFKEVTDRLQFTFKWVAEGDVNSFSRVMDTLSPTAYSRLLVANEQLERMVNKTYQCAQYEGISKIQPLGERNQNQQPEHSGGPLNAFSAWPAPSMNDLETTVRDTVKMMKYESTFDLDEWMMAQLDSIVQKLSDTREVGELIKFFERLCEEWDGVEHDAGEGVTTEREIYQHTKNGQILGSLAMAYFDYAVFEWHEYLGWRAADRLRKLGLTAESVFSDELKPQVSEQIDLVDKATVVLIEKIRPIHERATTISLQSYKERMRLSSEG